MKHGPNIARTAALIGDPARANMLMELLDGRALTASELASVAGIGAPTASSHLSQLRDGGLVQMRQQGRHRYYALADDEVAAVLEGLLGLAAGTGEMRVRTGPRDADMRVARVCYNHLAGQKGVQMFQSLVAKGLLDEQWEEVNLTLQGVDFMLKFGIDLPALEKGKSKLCRACLDWSERRSHLSGSLGRAMLTRMEGLGWIRRDSNRTLRFSPKGQAAFDRAFPIN